MKRTRFFLFVTIVSILILEAFLWGFFPVTGEKNISYQQRIPGLKSHVTYTANTFGFRSLSMKSRQKPGGVIRIFALGASTTDQMNQNTEDLWSAILEKRLNERFSSKVIKIEAAAWGRGGEKVSDRVRFVKEELSQYQPDIVLVLEGINDLCWSNGQATKPKKVWWVNRLKHKYSQIHKRFELIKKAEEHKALIREGKATEYHTDSLAQNHQKYLSLPYDPAPTRDPDPIVAFRDGIRALGDLSKTQGFKLVYLAQPVLWKAAMTEAEKSSLWFYVNTPKGPVRPDTAWLEREMNRYNEIQAEEASRSSADYVPLHTLIPKTMDHFFDDCHFTDAGNLAVAAAVLPYLEKHLSKTYKNKPN